MLSPDKLNAWEVIILERATGTHMTTLVGSTNDDGEADVGMDVVAGLKWLEAIRNGEADLPAPFAAVPAFQKWCESQPFTDLFAGEDDDADPTTPPPTAASNNDSATTSPASAPSTAKRRKPSAK
jgi:hypothetical protein